VARASGCDGSAGSMLDAVVDRVADAAPFVGLAIFYRDRTATLVVPLSALVASSLISYARAKAETLGLDLPSGPMRRHERIAYLALGLLLGPLVPAYRGVACPATLAIVALIALLSLGSSLLLMVRARTALLVIDRARPRPPPT
jgi:CDP-diacylglycerol--glycerol-3-phosphate 3-phosphatidyltransferase